MRRSALLGVAVVGLLLSCNARAAITLQDGGTNVIKTSANSITSPGFTVTAGASVLVVNVFTRDNQTADALPATLPWGSQTLTKVASVNNGNSTWAWSEIYYLYNPAAMSQDITISEGPSSQAMTMQVFTLAGVDTTFNPVPYTAVNNNAQTLRVNLAGTPSGSWAAVSSSYGTGNLLMNVTASSGIVYCQPVQNSTSQDMGYVSNITSSASTITATDNAGNQKLSLAVAVFFPAGALPGAPNLAAAASGSQVTLTWSAVGNASSYNVLRSTTSGGETLLAGNQTGTTYTDTTTAIGTTYYYEVQAVNANGPSGNSTEVSVTPLPAPTGLAATAQTNQVALSWSSTSGATGYDVLRSITSGGPYSTIATGVASTSYIDHTVYDGTPYYYVVEAVNSSATGAASAQAGPATPFFALPAGAATGVLLKDGGTNSITTTGSGVSTISSSFTVSSGAHVLVVELWDNDTANNGSSPSVMTWVVGSTTNVLIRAVSQSSSAADCNIYYVFNPTSGAGTISATDDNGASVQAMSMMPFTLRGVDTTVAPVIYQSTSASATTVSVNLASVTPSTAWAAVISSDSSTGQALTQTSTSGTSIYQSVNNNACLGYVQNLAGGNGTIAMHGASGAVSLAVAVFMPAVATPIAILDGSVATVADGGGSGTTVMPFSVSEGATVLTAALGQIDNSNPFTTNILWANTTLGVTQNVFAVASEWAGYGQIHPNVHALIDPLPGNGFLIAVLPAGNSASHLFLQAYTLVGVDTAIPTAVYGAGTESTLPGGLRTNYVAVNLASGTPANSWAEVCTYDNAGNLSALMTIGATNNGASVGTVVTTNFNPSVLCTAGYISNLPNSACTVSALHGVAGAADALGVNVAVFSPLVLQTLPAAPINVVATAHTGEVTLSWADNSNATSYNVYRSMTSGSGYQLIATTIGGTATNFTDTYVVGGTTYYYVIAGVNIAGQSPNSAEVSATPSSGPIIGTGISVVDGSVNNNITVGAVTSFSMPFSVSYGASVLVAATYDNNGNNSGEKGPALVWSNATAGITQPLTAAVVGTPGADNQTWGTLYYLMAPVPGVGAVVATETAPGQAATFLQVYTLGGVDTNTPPTTAESGSIGASTLSVDTDPGTLSFSWAAVLAADYDGGGGNDVAITSTSGSVTTVNTRPNGLQFRAGYISNLGAGDTTITATKSGTTGTSMYLATEVFAPLITMPAPATVTATGQTNQILVTWATVSGATSYVLLRSTISGHAYTPISTNSTSSYTDTTVADWVPYYYVVQAYGPNGVSIYSPEANAYAVGTPSAARGLTAFGDINRVDLSWSVELGADSYTVLRSTTSGGEATLVSGLTDTNYIDSSVVDGTHYYYKVRVVNNTYGTGPASAEASAIPVVTFFTNWFGIFTSPGGTIGTWTAINGSPNINLAENTVLGAPDFPSSGPSTDSLIIETNMGPNTTDDIQGMGNAFTPSINVRTYTSLELDIKNFGAYDRNNQIQAIQLSLQVPVGGVPTYERGTWGDIVLSAVGTGGTWTHYTAPLTNWAAYDLTQVTSVGINVFDSLYTSSVDMAVGFANLEFSGAPGWAPTFSVANRTVPSGSTSALLLGKVSGIVDDTNLFLSINTPISVTINGSTQNTVINDATGDFSIEFNTTGFGNGTYPVTYISSSDMVALLGATNSSTSLTISGAPPSKPTIQTPAIDGTGTNLVVKVATQSGYLYYLLTTTSLTPPAVWSTNSVTVGTGGTITELVPIIRSQPGLFLRFLVQ